jgi:hypothetical protein
MRNRILKFSELFEDSNTSDIPGEISVYDFCSKIGFQNEDCEIISEWWSRMRPDIRLHYFPFSSPHPIAGVFLSGNDVAINSKLDIPKEMKLFLSLHESKHADQHKEGDFDELYFKPVLDGNMDAFVRGYNETEKEANDFAIGCMLDLGFDRFIEMQERNLRSNELAGRQVYKMMQEDIAKHKSYSFVDLIRSQILPG